MLVLFLFFLTLFLKINILEIEREKIFAMDLCLVYVRYLEIFL